jgi:hypothetical protein
MYIVAFGNEEREEMEKGTNGKRVGRLLLWWVVSECNTLGDVTLETFHAGLEECLFVIIKVCEWVLDLLNTGSLHMALVEFQYSGKAFSYAKLNWNREEFTASLLSDLFASW